MARGLQRAGRGPARPSWGSFRTAVGLVVLLLAVMAAAGGWLLEVTLGPSIDRWAVQQMTLLASRVVAEAAAEVSHSPGTSPLVNYQMGPGGDVVGIQYNWLAINNMIARTVQILEQRLKALAVQDVAVPLGEITGLRLFGGRGPLLQIRLVSVGAFTVEPFSEFREAGFNQTLHRIGLGLSVTVAVIAPFVRNDVTVRADIPVVENQVLGKVPAFLLQMSQEGLRIRGGSGRSAAGGAPQQPQGGVVDTLGESG